MIPLVLFLSVAVTITWLATLPKRQDLRIIFCLLVVIGVSVVVAAVAYPLGGYYLRNQAYQGNREIKEFLTDLETDLKSSQMSLAQEKIEFILERWDETEFIENNPEYGTWIGDRVDKSKLLKYKTETIKVQQ